MFTPAEFGRRTVASAAAAAQLYFKPLSVLIHADAGGTSGPLRQLHPLALLSTAHLRRPLRRWQTRIAQPGDPAAVRADTRSALVWSDGALQEVEQLSKMIEVEYTDLAEQWYGTQYGPPLRPLYYPTLLSSWFRRAAWLLMAMELAFVTILASVIFQFGMIVALSIGALVTLALTLVATASAGAAILGRFEHRPRRANEVLLALITVVGCSILTLVGGLFMTRTGGAAPQVSLYLMLALGILTPALVALLQSGARLLGWSSEQTRHWQEVQELRNEIVALHVHVSALLEERPRKKSRPQDRRSSTRAIHLDE